MQSINKCIGVLCLVAVVLATGTASVHGDGEAMVDHHATLPASLEQYYPPVSPAPAYLLAMMSMSHPFSAIVSDALEGDLDHVAGDFDAFKKAYLGAAAMVPEWTDRYPIEPVDRLAEAVATRDMSQIMPAVEAVGAVCHSCHLSTMAPVQHRFHWGRFADITLTDPLSGADVSYARLMLMMETNFSGIGADLAQGQIENARAQFAGFKSRFDTFGDACMVCHETERHYYVSDDIDTLIAALESELAKPEVDAARAGELMQSIGRESCSKCHLVHIPAAYAQQAARAHSR